MTLFIKSTSENSITLPTWLMSLLKLQEGELAPQLQDVMHRLDEVITTLLKFRPAVKQLTLDNLIPPFETISEPVSNNLDEVLQADDPIFTLAGQATTSVNNLSALHDHYLYGKPK